MIVVSPDCISTESSVLPPFRLCPATTPDTTRTRILAAIRRAVVYYTIVEYAGHPTEPPVPLGVIVLCPGRGYQEARFCLANVPVPPGTLRWKQIRASLRNLTRAPPATLSALQEEIREQGIRHSLISWRARRLSPVLRFRPVQAILTKPHALLDRLFEEEIMGHRTETLEKELEAESAAPTVCQFIGSMIRYMKPSEAETALALLAEQEDTTSYDVALLIIKHVMRSINTKPISPEQLERILVAWERVPHWEEGQQLLRLIDLAESMHDGITANGGLAGQEDDEAITFAADLRIAVKKALESEATPGRGGQREQLS